MATDSPFCYLSGHSASLDRFETDNIIEAISHPEWAVLIVALPKKDDKFRICGDYEVSTDPLIEVDQHPLPCSEEILALLAGEKKFDTFDLYQAYTQIILDDVSFGYVTINTHKGLYSINV